MHQDEIERWQHSHAFNVDKQHIEKKTLLVVIITFLMMIAEILFGWLSNSLALLADGWHMGTHAFALGLSLLAYVMARKHAANQQFTFGSWKIEILGAYSSALVLGLVGIMMIYTSLDRLLHPLLIHYNQALLVALLGLKVNIICAVILGAGSHAHKHHHTHEHSHPHPPQTKDLNHKSAYLHVVADALTSVFAIVALLCAKYFGLTWLDPVMGLVGAGLIGRWAFQLLKESSAILLDHEKNPSLASEIRKLITADGHSQVADLHLLKVADEKYAAILSVVTAQNITLAEYRQRLAQITALAHLTIEIKPCRL